MSKKRIKIDLEDDQGTKYNLNLEGNVTRDKVLKVFELMDLLNIEDESEKEHSAKQIDSTGAKIWNIVEKYYPMGKFTSNNILEKYEDEYNEPIKLSIISTYLSRFSAKGKVNRSKHGREWAYQKPKIVNTNNTP